MYRRGFTVVELIIVVTIMGILLVLGVVNLRGSQASARDSERKADIEALALNLESFYKTGREGSTLLGRYPSTGLTTSGATSIQSNLRNIDLKSVMAPGISDPVDTLKSATNTNQTTTGITPLPDIQEYIYQPLQQNGTLCTSGSQLCQKFNLYYRLEIADISDACPTPGFVCKVTSKNQ